MAAVRQGTGDDEAVIQGTARPGKHLAVCGDPAEELREELFPLGIEPNGVVDPVLKEVSLETVDEVDPFAFCAKRDRQPRGHRRR